MEMRCAIMVSAYSSTSLSRMVGEVRKRLMIGVSPGLTLRKEGGGGMPGGRSGIASAIAVSSGDGRSHGVRIRARKSRVHADRRVVHLGEIAHSQVVVRDDAEQRDTGH